MATEFVYDEIPSGVDPAAPLIYLWQVTDDSGTPRAIYVGKAKGGARRPRTHYARNVRRLLLGQPYRRSAPDGYRDIHRRLAEAVCRGHRVSLLLLRNVYPGEIIDAVEREEQARHGCANASRAVT